MEGAHNVSEGTPFEKGAGKKEKKEGLARDIAHMSVKLEELAGDGPVDYEKTMGELNALLDVIDEETSDIEDRA